MKPPLPMCKTLRRERGWSIDALAKKAGLARMTIIRAERPQSGGAGGLSLYAAVAIAGALKTTVDALLSENETVAKLVTQQNQIATLLTYRKR